MTDTAATASPSMLEKIRSRLRGRAPSFAPPDTVLYAIGDIHARYDLLLALTERIVADAARRKALRRTIVYLGDYVSRGTDSRRVLDLLVDRPPLGFDRITLKGNHEDLLLRFVDGDLDAARHWFDYGGLETLEHYGVAIPNREARGQEAMELLRERFIAALPPSHLDFLRRLEISHVAGDYYFVHGGIRPGVPLAEQSEYDRMWIRGTFLNSDLDHGAVVVHGHSIAMRPERRHNRIGVDTGAYRTGVLTCAVLEGAGCDFLQT